jgi:putative transposase
MAKQSMVESSHPDLSIRTQCDLLSLARSTYYYEPAGETALNLELMRRLDELYMQAPFYGVPQMTKTLRRQGFVVNPKRIRRLMRLMGLQAVGPRPKTSKPAPEHKIYPYLLKGVEIVQPNQVWATDITYIPMTRGFMYLVAVMDWYSRYVLSWQISNTMDVSFCLLALEEALHKATPKVFNSDQGAQFTSLAFTERLLDAKVQISMDGRGRFWENIFIERLWRTVKYEHIYLNDYDSGFDLVAGLDNYFHFYNTQRPHASLDDRTPWEAYSGCCAAPRLSALRA